MVKAHTIKAVTPAKAGVQKCLFFLDSGFRRNDRRGHFPTFYERIKLHHSKFFVRHSTFGLPWRDVISSWWCFMLATVHLLMTLSCMPGLGQGFRDSNLAGSTDLD